MQPDSAAPADPLTLLRQQVILAQVRIMELEDVRDELQPQLATLEKLLGAAQLLVDQKSDEAAHLEKMRIDLQAQYEHMRHMQHITQVALTAATEREAQLHAETETLQAENRHLSATGQEYLSNLTTRETQLEAAQTEITGALERIRQLDAEKRALKASRSWRWTAWLRSVERRLGIHQP